MQYSAAGSTSFTQRKIADSPIKWSITARSFRSFHSAHRHHRKIFLFATGLSREWPSGLWYWKRLNIQVHSSQFVLALSSAEKFLLCPATLRLRRVLDHTR